MIYNLEVIPIKQKYPSTVYKLLGIPIAIGAAWFLAYEWMELSGAWNSFHTTLFVVFAILFSIPSIYTLIFSPTLEFHEEKIVIPSFKYWKFFKGETFKTTYEGIQVVDVGKLNVLTTIVIYFISTEGDHSDIELDQYLLTKKMRKFIYEELPKRANLTKVEKVNLTTRYSKENSKIDPLSLEQAKFLGK